MNNVYEAEAVNWEVGSQYDVLTYTNSAGPFEPSLYMRSHPSAQFYFGFTLSDAVIVRPAFHLAKIDEEFAGLVGLRLQYHPRGYATSGVFVSGIVIAAFSSSDNPTLHADSPTLHSDSPTLHTVGVGLGYQRRLKSNFVFRIGTSIVAVSSQFGGRSSLRLYDADGFMGGIYTSLGYTFNMSD